MMPSSDRRMAGGRVLASALLGVAALATSPHLHSDPEDASSAAYEIDRPGELENPFSIPAGGAQFISYLLAANGEGRDDAGLGSGGSATALQTGLRIGLGADLEGQVFADTVLNESDRGPDGDDPGVSRAGLSDVTLRLKWTLLAADDGESGFGLAPLVRLPINGALEGSSSAVVGVVLPFNFELGRGFEVEGSTAVSRGPGDDGGHASDWETETSLEWQFAPRWSLYWEPEIDVGEGRPAWAMEQGITFDATKRVEIDLGCNTGIGSNAAAHFAYLGVGWRL